MTHRPTTLRRRAAGALACALGLLLSACGGGNDATAPDPGPPTHDPTPGPQQPPPDQNAGITGQYVLTQINGSKPGQMVSVANPDGILIGLYRFDASTTLTLDPLQTFELQINYSDDKGAYGLGDQGEFKSPGEVQGTLALTFTSAVYGDAFEGGATDGVVAIQYDFDGDGRPDTVFTFQRVG